MNQKKILYVALGLGLLVTTLLFVLQFRSGSETVADSFEEYREASIQNPNLFPMGGSFASDGNFPSLFDENSPRRSFGEFMEDLRTGKIVFVWELWELRSQCPKDFLPSQCDSYILSELGRIYSGSEASQFLDLFKSYFQYEDAVRNLALNENIDFEERYSKLKEARKKHLGDSKSNLIFGLEESQVEFLDRSRAFLESTKSLSPDKRVQEYEALKRKIYGAYYENALKREDRFEHYQMEIQLREQEFSGLSEQEKEQKLRELDTKYFGKEKAKLMAEARAEEQLEEKKIHTVLKEEEEFRRKNQNLSTTELEKRFMEIRIRHLGVEGAESFTRRQKFEEETRGQF
jgi:hypothetical protein